MADILLIDDDVDLVDMNKRVLSHRGHKVFTAYSAAEARKQLHRSFDVVILDVMMETMSAGFDLAREIHEKYPAMPTLILSGVHDVTGLPFRFEPDPTWLPVLKFLDKPVEPAKLCQEVEAALKQ